MSNTFSRFFNEIKATLMCSLVIILVALFNTKGELSITDAIIGMLMISVLAVLSLRIKSLLPFKLPAFAWASLLGLLVTLPASPIQEVFLRFTNSITTAPIGTVILAAAGISIGTKLTDVKKLSWKILVVSLVVFCGTFFGSAIISHIVLKLQGII